MSNRDEPECKHCGAKMEYLGEQDQCGSSDSWYWCSKCGTVLDRWDDRIHWNEIEDPKHCGVRGEWKIPESANKGKEKVMT